MEWAFVVGFLSGVALTFWLVLREERRSKPATPVMTQEQWNQYVDAVLRDPY